MTDGYANHYTTVKRCWKFDAPYTNIYTQVAALEVAQLKSNRKKCTQNRNKSTGDQQVESY